MIAHDGIEDLRINSYSYSGSHKITPKMFLFSEKVTRNFFDDRQKSKINTFQQSKRKNIFSFAELTFIKKRNRSFALDVECEEMP